ncbi:O-fucosyltransferase 36-like [Amaranthus tricolor]|uniref:O-fucosyltransferase 36-like n=1 Tax=Amaranthus tricolor TaxID=29722 RepID=UPI002588C3B2|nr:O-fucosyltransferase 36-like [Amaranthus tricolor]
MMKQVGREGTSSDDEEEDRQNLIHQNDSQKPTSNSQSISPFHIDNTGFVSSLRHRFKMNKKRYLLVIFIPLIVVFLYFSLGFHNNSSVWDIKLLKSPSDQMREAELKALYLLKEQQLALISLLNRTLGTSLNTTSIRNHDNNNTSGYLNLSEMPVEKSVFEDLKSRIFDGIMLNKEIQKVLLSTHKNGNSSELGVGNDDLVDGGISICGKVDQKLAERKTIEWNPSPDKYLLAICLSGQMSNHLVCLEKHIFFAAVLGRVLVIPSHKVDYEFSRVLDIEHINKCIGRKVVVTFEDFMEVKKKDLHVDKFICYFSNPQKCYVDEDHVKKLKSLGLSVPKLESPWEEDVKKPKKRTIEDVKAKFSSDEGVIAIGDVFFADVENEWVMQPGGPIAHQCKTLIEPSRLILITAQRFIQTFLGKDFVALHFRRHGWLKFCNAKNPSCFFSIPQAAKCIERVVARANTPVIYLSTDAADSETGLLQALVLNDGKPVPLVQRPARNSAEKWDALLYRHGLEGDSQVEAMLDKTICAMSSVFIGSAGSTFTEDILRLRKGWGTLSVCDEYICQGEVPNFIAENE